MRPATILISACLFVIGCGAKSKQATRVAIQSLAAGMEGYARTADPHITWCDNHGGFVDRAYDNETVSVTLDNGQTGTGTIQHIYIVCGDGTRIKER